MRSWLTGWLPLLRIARRDALRARGRSILIVAMIALPIIALTAADVLARSAQLDPDEVVARELGRTQARLQLGFGGPVLQAPFPNHGIAQPDRGGDLQPAVTDLRAVTPPGMRVLTFQQSQVDTRTRAGIGTTGWEEVRIDDRAFHGRYALRAGHAPRRTGEVAVTSDLFDRLGVPIGHQVTLTDPARRFTLTGVVDQAGVPGLQTFFARPGQLIGTAALAAEEPPQAYLAGDTPVTWADVLALNRQGVVVTSRDVLLDLPPRSAVPYYREGLDSSTRGSLVFAVLSIVVVVVLAALEVTLLAGAAFAVGARRQAHSLGLVAVAGGSPGAVRRVVLAGGVVLGLAAAAVGVLLGLLAAALSRPVLTDLAEQDFGHFEIRPVELLAIAMLGLVTGVLAAVLPARTAARQDPVAALTGRRGQVRTARKVPVIGLLLVVAGVGAAALGSGLAVALTTGLNPTNGRSTTVVAALIAGGAALAQVGLIVASPAIIGLAARLARRLPLPGRLAVRDSARHRGRSAPAMAAVLTAVTGSTALLLLVTAQDAHDREQYRPSWPAHSAGIQLTEYRYDRATGKPSTVELDPRTVLAAVAGQLPPFRSRVVTSTVEMCAEPDCVSGYVNVTPPPENECPLLTLHRAPTPAETRRATTDPRCTDDGTRFSGNFDGTPVGGSAVVDLVTAGRSTRAAADTLARGGVVVFSRGLVRDDGTVTFQVVTDAEARAAQDTGKEPQPHDVSLPATYLPVPEVTGGSAVYSPAAARTLGLQTRPGVLLLTFGALPSTDQEDAARRALQAAGIGQGLSVERGYTSSYGLGLLALVGAATVITLGAAGIATGLAQADARADHATLAAVGAAPRVRRTLAAAQALTIALMGALLGIAAGFVPALALIGAVDSLHVVVPWVRLATVLVGVPLLAGALAWLLTRSRVPLERRLG